MSSNNSHQVGYYHSALDIFMPLIKADKPIQSCTRT